MDAEFFFETSDFDGGAFFADEEAESQTAGAVGFAACQDKQDFAAAVGDEAFDAVEEPLALLVLIDVGGGFDGL